MIWSAACASLNVPGIYDPVSLMVKKSNGEIVEWSGREIKWGVAADDEDTPYNRLAELFNVNNFIVSKIAPFKFPLVDYFFPQLPVPSSASLITRLCGFFLSELSHRLYQLDHLGLLPNICKKLQKLIANSSQFSENVITISPNIRVRELPYMMSHPNENLTKMSVLKGESATWPLLSNLTIRMKIEVALITILDDIKRKTPKLAPIYEMLLTGIEQEGREKLLVMSGMLEKRKRTKSLY